MLNSKSAFILFVVVFMLGGLEARALVTPSNFDPTKEDQVFSEAEYLKHFMIDQSSQEAQKYSHLFEAHFIYKAATDGTQITLNELAYIIAHSYLFDESIKTGDLIHTSNFFQKLNPTKKMATSGHWLYKEALNIYLHNYIKPPKEEYTAWYREEAEFSQQRPNDTPLHGTTPLHVAVLKKDIFALKFLIGHYNHKLVLEHLPYNLDKPRSAPFNTPDAFGHTPLHLALRIATSTKDSLRSYSKYKQLIEPLIKTGADPNTHNNRGENILHNKMHFLSQNYVKPHDPTLYQPTGSQFVTLSPRLFDFWFTQEIMPQLNPVTLNHVDFRGHTPLIKLALSWRTHKGEKEKEKLQLFQDFVAQGASVSAVDEYGRDIKEILAEAFGLREEALPYVQAFGLAWGAAPYRMNTGAAKIINHIAQKVQAPFAELHELGEDGLDFIHLPSENKEAWADLEYLQAPPNSGEYKFLQAVYSNNLAEVFKVLNSKEFAVGEDVVDLPSPVASATMKALFWATANNYAEMVAYLLARVVSNAKVRPKGVKGITMKTYKTLASAVLEVAAIEGADKVLMSVVNLGLLDFPLPHVTFVRRWPETNDLIRDRIFRFSKKDIVQPHHLQLAIKNNHLDVAEMFLWLLFNDKSKLITSTRAWNVPPRENLTATQKKQLDEWLTPVLLPAIKTRNLQLIGLVLRLSPNSLTKALTEQGENIFHTVVDLKPPAPEILNLVFYYYKDLKGKKIRTAWNKKTTHPEGQSVLNYLAEAAGRQPEHIASYQNMLGQFVKSVVAQQSSDHKTQHIFRPSEVKAFMNTFKIVLKNESTGYHADLAAWDPGFGQYTPQQQQRQIASWQNLLAQYTSKTKRKTCSEQLKKTTQN